MERGNKFLNDDRAIIYHLTRLPNICPCFAALWEKTSHGLVVGLVELEITIRRSISKRNRSVKGFTRSLTGLPV